MSGSFMVDGLHVRVCAPRGTPRGAILFVHGATVASVLFDIPVPGYSVLQACADAGWWSFACDLRGYAASERPESMQEPPDACPLVCTGSQAVADVGTAVAAALKCANVDRLVLAGGSWGSLTAARYALAAPSRVERLVLIAPLFGTVNPVWLKMLADPVDGTRINPALGGYRYVTRNDLLSRWDPEIPHGHDVRRRDPVVLDALVRAELHADTRSPRGDAFRAPNGTLHDLFEVFSGRPLYRPEGLHMPCLLIRGADDLTSTHADVALLHDRLGSAHKPWVTIADAGHFLQAERAAPAFMAALLEFMNSK